MVYLSFLIEIMLAYLLILRLLKVILVANIKMVLDPQVQELPYLKEEIGMKQLMLKE